MAHHQQCRSNHSSASSIPEPCPKRRTGTSADSDMVADSNDEDNPRLLRLQIPTTPKAQRLNTLLTSKSLRRH
ncbi:hypothetical protein H4Q26_003811 [Puccinia striiformis f. sp. tritici PST-130]|nr:hypothetical protein H4Q26_003811 [Puccinia striiformis f. sp. tritici PST-130]